MNDVTKKHIKKLSEILLEEFNASGSTFRENISSVSNLLPEPIIQHLNQIAQAEDALRSADTPEKVTEFQEHCENLLVRLKDLSSFRRTEASRIELELLKKPKTKEKVKWTDKANLLVAIFIPIIIYISGAQITERQDAAAEIQRSQQAQDAKMYRQQQFDLNLKNRTLDRLLDLGRRVGSEYRDIQIFSVQWGKKPSHGETNYSYSYINDHPEVQSSVLIILNEYEEVCLGLKQSLYDESIFNDMRLMALKQTFEEDFKGFITQWISQDGNADAWKQCREYLDAPKEKPVPNG